MKAGNLCMCALLNSLVSCQLHVRQSDAGKKAGAKTFRSKSFLFTLVTTACV
jgi:hypothetical protein